MNKIILFCWILLFGGSSKCKSMEIVKNFKCDYSSDGDERYSDYITLIYNDDSIVKGLYYGLTGNLNDSLYFVANMNFERTTDDSFSFSLVDYKFSKNPIPPFSKLQYHLLEKPTSDLQGEVKFWGRINKQELLLNRTMWYYDSRSDRVIFNLEK